MQVPFPGEGSVGRARSDRLRARIASEIRACGGFIPFWRYMELALYEPHLGYYATREVFGAAGDYVTAPLLGDGFGRCLARQCAEVLAEVPGGALCEFGAGTGDLAAVVLESLAAMGRAVPAYRILELSSALRVRQRATLERRVPEFVHQVRWLNRLPESFRGVVIANEVLDAMPVSRFRMTEEGPRELGVTLEGEDFREVLLPDRLQANLPELPPGYVSEVNLHAQAWVRSLAERLAQGVVLIVDYGFPRREFYHPQRSQGTLMCHHRHRAHGDPYVRVGLQDITAHLDFSALAEVAVDAGLEVLGYTHQAAFLLALGLLDDPVAESELLRWSSEVRMLISPAEMGELFKVLAVGRGIARPLRGFSLLDQTHRL